MSIDYLTHEINQLSTPGGEEKTQQEEPVAETLETVPENSEPPDDEKPIHNPKKG
ncbi:MAG TPA: hypothetical protein VGO63_01140 [Candidatus Paceibacterota bacterium]|nr:hypothetical protein [Candidatus Paceibacterota bacterium]